MVSWGFESGLFRQLVHRRESVKVKGKGFLICPKCGKKTKTKIIPGTTVLMKFPLFCSWCHEETIIDYK